MHLVSVYNISKIKSRKQITTVDIISLVDSQCLQYFKDKKSKANHNVSFTDAKKSHHYF